MRSLSLQGLLAPLGLDEFFASYWRKRSYFRSGASEAREHLERMLGGLSPEHLAHRSGACDAVGYVNGLDRHDNLPPAQALAYYARGHTLYLNLYRAIPECARLADDIVRELDLPPPMNVCSAAFISKPDRGVQPHLDVNENFTIQLSGRKVWTLWTEEAVPDTIHNAVQGELRIDPVAAMYMGPTPDRTDLGRGVDVVMEPGCVLYNPSGMWHTTRALTESVSMNIAISPLTFYQLMLGVTEARLATDETIRRNVPRRGMASNEFERQWVQAVEASKRALDLDPTDALVLMARSDIRNRSLSALSASCQHEITANTRLRRNSLVAIDVERKAGVATLRATLFLGRLTRHADIFVPPGLEAACRAAVGMRGEFAPESLAWREVLIEDAVSVCRALESVGAFRLG